MHPGTHVWPHTGPTNCRLRMHLGLVIPKEGCKIRCANETRYVSFVIPFFCTHPSTVDVLRESLWSMGSCPFLQYTGVKSFTSRLYFVTWLVRCHSQSEQVCHLPPERSSACPAALVLQGGQPCIQSQFTCLKLPTFCIVL